MNGIEYSQLTWFKSTRSSANGQCVEGAHLPHGGMAVRDSKHLDSPMLLFSANKWQAFIQGVKVSEPE